MQKAEVRMQKLKSPASLAYREDYDGTSIKIKE